MADGWHPAAVLMDGAVRSPALNLASVNLASHLALARGELFAQGETVSHRGRRREADEAALLRSARAASRVRLVCGFCSWPMFPAVFPRVPGRGCLAGTHCERRLLPHAAGWKISPSVVYPQGRSCSLRAGAVVRPDLWLASVLRWPPAWPLVARKNLPAPRAVSVPFPSTQFLPLAAPALALAAPCWQGEQNHSDAEE
jgi:hypothetical protein